MRHGRNRVVHSPQDDDDTRTSELEERYSRPGQVGVLWFGFLGGFLAWKLHLMVSYALVPYACWHDLSILIDAASLVFALMALRAAWAEWSVWREVGGHPIGPGGFDESVSATLGRTRFMAISGVIVGVFSAVVIFAQWFPNLILSPCFGIS